MGSEHSFEPRIVWTGNKGSGTSSYTAYERTWDIAVPGMLPVSCSNDPRLGGDPSKLNPEDLLIGALSACHMLWYLHFASEAGIVVYAYEDRPEGIGRSEKDGSGQFISAALRPRITVNADADLSRAHAIHGEIHKVCFIARSVNFPVNIEPEFTS